MRDLLRRLAEFEPTDLPVLSVYLDMRPHGLVLALPEKVEMARPTGVGRALAAYDTPIEGRDEWLAAARRLA